jgi:2'-hydroxyisoflavone reductase
MKVLVVGGTGFLGGAVASAALAEGHDVSVFTRSGTAALPGSNWRLIGDRFDDRSALTNQHFDLVVDTCAFAPDAVALLLETLAPTIGCYALVSSISVYDDFSTAGMDETAPTSHATEEHLRLARALTGKARDSSDGYGEAYGPLKRAAEEAAVARLGHRALLLRAGLLVGARDYTDRLTYWVRRIDQGGTIAVPGSPQRPVQMIDVRDAANFILTAARNGHTGAFNLTGKPMPFATLLEACIAAAGVDLDLRWIDDATIAKAGIAGWTELPLWLPQKDEAYRNFLNVSIARALAAGLKLRPIGETLTQLLQWDRSRRGEALKAGLSPEKENLLLQSQSAA